MTKSPYAFRSIGEVARMVGVATHVLRYWEAQFPILSPVKRSDGRRYYRPDDVMLAAGICEALREDGLTIRGAKRLIAQDRGEALRERGRVRLGAQLGIDSAEDARPARPARSRAAAERPATARKPSERKVPARATGADTLPLFPDLADTAPNASTQQWLARLTATAAALRSRGEPLPEHAAGIARDLRQAAATVAGY